MPQYWIREVDLSAEEKEYLHEYLPASMKEEDAKENNQINKTVLKYSKRIKELMQERKEILKELREIRFGLKVSYYCMEEDFDEDNEQKLQDYELKFIEYEDDIANLTENIQELQKENNEYEILNQKLAKRVEELNGIIGNISKGTSETVENFLKSYKKTNELIYKNKELQEELDSKNEEIESMKNSSIVGRGEFLSNRGEGDEQSEVSKEGSHKPEFEIKSLSVDEHFKSRTMEINSENDLLRSKIRELEEEIMDVQNRNNLIMNQNKNLKNEVKELEAKLFSWTAIEERKSDLEDESADRTQKEIDHIKNLLIQFLKKTPITDKGSELLLSTLFSMLYVSKPEVEEIQQARRLISAEFEEEIIKKNKKGMFGFFKRSKSRK